MSNKSKVVESICRKLCIIRGQNPDAEIYNDSENEMTYMHQWEVYIKDVEMYLDINHALHNLPNI